MRIAAGLIVLLLLCLVNQSAAADRRVALVIGNGAYLHAPHLPNPPHDAEDVGAALKRTGFETIVGLDLDKNKMEEAAIRFAALRAMPTWRCSITAATRCNMQGSTT